MKNENIFSDENKTIIGIDVGSTTVKLIVVKNGKIIYKNYQRHFSQVRQKTLELVNEIKNLLEPTEDLHIAISGSAGFGMSKSADIPFVQEVFATGETVKYLEKDINAVIELGGEDAKIIFFNGNSMDERMNGTCAGGTGAFIDQMATLLNVTTEQLDELSLNHTRIYPIASRCGVFAKTDIQPLINQGAKKEDIAASIFQAVVNQTISGLAQGYEIKGRVMFLGGPLFYLKGLQERFKETLKLSDEGAIFPDYALYSVAIGTAIYAKKQEVVCNYNELVERIQKSTAEVTSKGSLPPLFSDENDYNDFKNRHSLATVKLDDIKKYSGNSYLGIDCGSTTTKLVLINENNDILYSYYGSNEGNPLNIVKKCLEEIYSLCDDRITISKSAVTGYGEELVLNAFHIDTGIVETMAHFYAARHFNPKVDFILDIGGQDIKCFKIHNNSIDSIMLNEACSSGCGSFIETFAKSMGYNVEEFSKLGLQSKKPVNLGSRCTVFMNSSVKQAQKDGANVSDISAGLSISVVKNAIYKVIRANNPEELGKEIVVQGGTFLNDAVLRSFEKELSHNVIRPKIAGLMGAYGAALYSKTFNSEKSTIISFEDLKNFNHTVKATNCNGCTNHCNLTINIFDGNRRFISGNKCEKAIHGKDVANSLPNLYEYKRNKFIDLINRTNQNNGQTIGIPLSLGMYELAPMWYEIFNTLGFNVLISNISTRETYTNGQYTIPSDTACYPAKLMHGHITELIEKNVDAIFYPCLTYNVNEEMGDNHYNCPVVAYYSELLNANVKDLEKTKFLFPYLNINNEKELAKELQKFLNKSFNKSFSYKDIKKAVDNGKNAYQNWMDDIKKQGEKAVDYANKNGKKVLILAGRPYHIDSEICHSIDKLASSLGFVVVSEDSISHLAKTPNLNVLNQWTYHTRMYNAAQFASNNNNVELVQLVSFGCGIDAITTDEIRSILESNGKLYTQIKIDEINNLGAVKIRLRSLIAALNERNENLGRK